jgi:hypothetical protein
VDATEIDLVPLAQDVLLEDLNRYEFDVVRRGDQNFHHVQDDRLYQLQDDRSIFFAEVDRKSFLEIPFVTPFS